MSGEASSGVSLARPVAEPMDAAVYDFKERMRLRGDLAKAASRMVSLDAQRLDGELADPLELLARKTWLARAVAAISGAASLEDFKKAGDEAVRQLYADFAPDASKPSREAFVGTAHSAFWEAARMAEASPGGLVSWSELAGHDPAARLGSKQRLGREIELAKATASLAAEGGGSAEAGLAKQKTRLMERFGFAALAIEGADKSPGEQSLMVAAMEKTLAAGARELGISERQVGMSGGYELRLIDSKANATFHNRAAYVDIERKIVGLPADSLDPGSFKHEWTHMLDARLAQTLARKVESDPGASEWTKEQVKKYKFFSGMPEPLQKLLPQAREGYWTVAAAAQGLESADALRQVERVRLDKLEALSARAEVALMVDPNLMYLLGKAGREELSGSIKGSLKHLLGHEELGKALEGSGAAAGFDFGAESKKQTPSGEGMGVAIKEIGDRFEEKFGPWWRTTKVGVVMDPAEAIAGNLNKIIQSDEAEAIREMARLKGSKDMPLSPSSMFAQSSHRLDVEDGSPGYMDSPHEMLSRTLGRARALGARVHELGAIGRAAEILKQGARKDAAWIEWQAGARAQDASFVPELDARSFAMVQEGFSKMTSAAGLGPAMLEKGAREMVEHALLSKTGRAALKNIESGLVAAGKAREYVVGVAERAYGSAAHAAGEADAFLEARGCKVAAVLRGVGALAAFGAYGSGKKAIEEAKRGNSAQAALAGGEAGVGAAVAAGSIAEVAGVARAAPLTRVLGPLGALLGYAGAVDSALKARAAGLEGDARGESRMWKGAGVRALGATGSLAGGMAAGAAIGSAFPVVGTIVGAVVGVGVAYATEKIAEHVEAPKMVDISSKLLAKRVAREKEAVAMAPALCRLPTKS